MYMCPGPWYNTFMIGNNEGDAKMSEQATFEQVVEQIVDEYSKMVESGDLDGSDELGFDVDHLDLFHPDECAALIDERVGDLPASMAFLDDEGESLEALYYVILLLIGERTGKTVLDLEQLLGSWD